MNKPGFVFCVLCFNEPDNNMCCFEYHPCFHLWCHPVIYLYELNQEWTRTGAWQYFQEPCIFCFTLKIFICLERERAYEDINLWQSEQIVFCTPGTI